jgi:aspartate/methionine/tyrosine aminotransferase
VILTSNPRNPTGKVVKNPELAEIQDICRDRATLVMDEFYGGYNYTSNCDGTTISAAENIDDVDEDDVLIIDGLTKRFRLPGWRIAWIIGPKVPPVPSLPSFFEIKIMNMLLIGTRNSSKRSAPADPTSTVARTFPSKKPQSPCSSPPKYAMK